MIEKCTDTGTHYPPTYWDFYVYYTSIQSILPQYLLHKTMQVQQYRSNINPYNPLRVAGGTCAGTSSNFPILSVGWQGRSAGEWSLVSSARTCTSSRGRPKSQTRLCWSSRDQRHSRLVWRAVFGTKRALSTHLPPQFIDHLQLVGTDRLVST